MSHDQNNSRITAVQSIISLLERVKAVPGLYLYNPHSIWSLQDFINGMLCALPIVGISLEDRYVLAASSFQGWGDTSISQTIDNMHDMNIREADIIINILDIYITAWKNYLITIDIEAKG